MNKLQLMTAVNVLQHFMPMGQLAYMVNTVGTDEGPYFSELIRKLAVQIMEMAATGETDGTDAMVVLHYFKGGADFYITERDIGDNGVKTDPISEQWQAFGLADPFGDGGEIGYICIKELIEAGVELDLHWTPKPLSIVKAARAA